MTLLAWFALAAVAQDDVSFEATTQVQLGDGEPSITFLGHAVGRIEVRLVCGSTPYALSVEIRPGSRHPLSLTGLGRGTHVCTGGVALHKPDGAEGELSLSFQVQLLDPLTWSFSVPDVDLVARTLTTHPSRPLTAATAELLGADGSVLQRVQADLTDATTPRFSWSTDEEVVVLVVVGTDAAGMQGRLELSPWSYAIPHDDVVFASGRHDVAAGELSKLDRTWSEVTAVLDKYGSVVDIELYVAGFTDTVGARDANRALSQRRARAIAVWFRQRGFTGPVWFQGFGETVLAVGTADETAEPRNRRALYVLAAQAPVSEALPGSAWVPLQ